jgi:hypothetical protein
LIEFETLQKIELWMVGLGRILIYGNASGFEGSEYNYTKG